MDAELAASFAFGIFAAQPGVTTTHTEIKPKYLEARRGDFELIRNYGVLPAVDETEED